MVTDFGTKIAMIRLTKEIRVGIHHTCTKQGVFEVRQFSGVIKIYLRHPLVAMATKMWKL